MNKISLLEKLEYRDQKSSINHHLAAKADSIVRLALSKSNTSEELKVF